MPRKKSRARLWLRREGTTATWIILDGGKPIRSGCAEHADQEAEKRLAEYLAQKYEAPGERRASKALIADVLLFYAKEKAPKLARPKAVASVLAKLGALWEKLTVAAVTGQNCRRYVEHRVDQGVSEPTARRELEDFSAALN